MKNNQFCGIRNSNVLQMGYAMKPAVAIKKGCSDDE